MVGTVSSPCSNWEPRLYIGGTPGCILWLHGGTRCLPGVIRIIFHPCTPGRKIAQVKFFPQICRCTKDHAGCLPGVYTVMPEMTQWSWRNGPGWSLLRSMNVWEPPRTKVLSIALRSKMKRYSFVLHNVTITRLFTKHTWTHKTCLHHNKRNYFVANMENCSWFCSSLFWRSDFGICSQ